MAQPEVALILDSFASQMGAYNPNAQPQNVLPPNVLPPLQYAGRDCRAPKIEAKNHDFESEIYPDFISFGENLPDALAQSGHNAVVALQSTAHSGGTSGEDINGNPAGTIYWSWHFWFTDYKPNVVDADATAALASPFTSTNTQAVTAGRIEQYGGDIFTSVGQYNTKYLMDRNLGAIVTNLTATWTAEVNALATDATTKYGTAFHGMLYQFGRKDPFVGNNGTATSTNDMTIYDAAGASLPSISAAATSASDAVTTATEGNLINAVNNPLTFYYIDGDWALPSGIVKTDYWQSTSGKSPFDPCPAGWRLPVKGTWDDFSTTSDPTTFDYSNTTYRGGVYDGRVFYPASGNRNNSSGSLNNVGNNGYNWSATPFSGTHGYILYFNSTIVYPSINSNRALGFPVRPIQE